MQVGILAAGELFGGVERHIVGMCTGLQAHGVGLKLFLFHDHELAAQARSIGVEPVILASRNRSILVTARRLSEMFVDNAIRILHVHGYKATVYAAAASERSRPLATFKTEHGLPEPARGLSPGALRNRLYFAAEAVATRRMNPFIFYVSNDLRSHYRRIHAGLRTEVIPNGVERMEQPEYPHPPDLPAGRFNVLIAGRVDVVKGHAFAIRAIAAKQVKGDVHLNVIGDGPSLKDVAVLANACGVADRVHLLGFRRNAYDYLAHCDAILMPSLHEGLPYTLLESMALGKPIIASRVGGLAETLEDNVNALLVPPSDPHAIAQAIDRLHGNPSLRRTLGNNAQQLQRERYTIDAMTSSYLAHYRKCEPRLSTEAHAA